jgi:DNA adenine methylase
MKAPATICSLRRTKLISFGLYGGKNSHLNWLLPYLPKCHHYCEPFAGSAAVLLNREPSPVETYNDLDGEVVNFFLVCRDHAEELLKATSLSPFSRDEFAKACILDPDATPLERARRFYVRARQVRTGLAQVATAGRWGNCKNTSRCGMSGTVSRYFGGVAMLPDIALRLLRVQIENRPAISAIQLYDSPGTLFYCDPPYLHQTRGDPKAYGLEMTDEQHRELASVPSGCKGKAAVSGYDCKLMAELYPVPRWRKFVGRLKTNHATKGKRVEVLWTNFNP